MCQLIPFLNDSISLTKNAFVVAQFIAPRTFKMSYISVMVFYFSELVLLCRHIRVTPKIIKMRTEFRTKRKIEFADTDMAGIVHFTRFFVFMESAEHEFLRSLGTSVATEWNGDKIGWPRLTASCDYLSPLRFEDEVEILLWVSKKSTKSLIYQFHFTHDGIDIARGQLTTVCCITNPGEKLRAIPIPEFIVSQIVT